MKFFGRCNILRTFGFYNSLINRQKSLKGVLDMSVLQTIDLKKYYGAEPNITRALDGVNFSVDKGELRRTAHHLPPPQHRVYLPEL